MAKKLLSILILILTSGTIFAFANPKAPETGDITFLYIYANDCGYCKKFSPIYKKLEKTYSNKCEFVKLNIASQDGYAISKSLHIWSVPFVIIVNRKDNSSVAVKPNCMLDYSCIDNVVSTITK